MRADSRGQTLAIAAVLLAVAATGCRVEPPLRPDPEVSTQINSLPPARARRSVPPPQPPLDYDQSWLVEKQCGGCHSMERVMRTRLDWNGWRGQVGHMVQNGADLTVPEQQALVDYLAGRW